MSVAQQIVPTGVWHADPVHSTVGFTVRHMVVATFRGGFRSFEATLDAGDGDPTLTGVVDVAGIIARDETLQGHLLSPDFFDAERHPQIRFDSTSFELADDGTLRVGGDLTIKGTTKRVEATGHLTGPGPDISGGERIGVELTAIVDRTAFGLDWNADLPSGGKVLANDVKLELELELAKSAQA